MKRIFKSRWLLALLPVLLIGGFIFYAYADSKRFWKVIDPRDPRFDINKFCFNDYGSHEELAVALKVVTPAGTPMAVADKILRGPQGRGGHDITNDKYFGLSEGGNRKIDIAALRKRTHRILFYGDGGCRKLMNSEFGWHVVVYYDDEDRLFQIIVWNTPLYNL